MLQMITDQRELSIHLSLILKFWQYNSRLNNTSVQVRWPHMTCSSQGGHRWLTSAFSRQSGWWDPFFNKFFFGILYNCSGLIATMLGPTYTSKGYHLAKCHSIALGQVPFRKIRNLAQYGHLARCLTVTCSSAAIHLAKCTDWSLIQVTSRTVYSISLPTFKWNTVRSYLPLLSPLSTQGIKFHANVILMSIVKKRI